MSKGNLRAVVFLNVIRHNDETGQTEVLLYLRQGTGELDGYWTLACGGHVKPDETLEQAMVRETKEEIGLDLEQYGELQQVKAFLAEPRSVWNVLTVVYEVVLGMDVEVRNMEPDQCGGLQWFELDALPENLDDQITFVQRVLDDWKRRQLTSET